jgi:hypothetical protein
MKLLLDRRGTEEGQSNRLRPTWQRMGLVRRKKNSASFSVEGAKRAAIPPPPLQFSQTLSGCGMPGMALYEIRPAGKKNKATRAPPRT